MEGWRASRLAAPELDAQGDLASRTSAGGGRPGRPGSRPGPRTRVGRPSEEPFSGPGRTSRGSTGRQDEPGMGPGRSRWFALGFRDDIARTSRMLAGSRPGAGAIGMDRAAPPGARWDGRAARRRVPVWRWGGRGGRCRGAGGRRGDRDRSGRGAGRALGRSEGPARGRGRVLGRSAGRCRVTGGRGGDRDRSGWGAGRTLGGRAARRAVAVERGGTRRGAGGLTGVRKGEARRRAELRGAPSALRASGAFVAGSARDQKSPQSTTSTW